MRRKWKQKSGKHEWHNINWNRVPTKYDASWRYFGNMIDKTVSVEASIHFVAYFVVLSSKWTRTTIHVYIIFAIQRIHSTKFDSLKQQQKKTCQWVQTFAVVVVVNLFCKCAKQYIRFGLCKPYQISKMCTSVSYVSSLVNEFQLNSVRKTTIRPTNCKFGSSNISILTHLLELSQWYSNSNVMQWNTTFQSVDCVSGCVNHFKSTMMWSFEWPWTF